MSAVKIFTFIFTANNPSGTFVSGDVMDVYYDTASDLSPGMNHTSNGYTVYKNGVQITSGNYVASPFSYPPVSYISYQLYYNQICNGNYLVQWEFQSSFPYANST